MWKLGMRSTLPIVISKTTRLMNELHAVVLSGADKEGRIDEYVARHLVDCARYIKCESESLAPTPRLFISCGRCSEILLVFGLSNDPSFLPTVKYD